MKPRALDLFCGAGGATKGLQQAGFHVTGIDIAAQPRYCGDAFIQCDAMAPPVDLFDFEFIWASPPCQRYSCVTPKAHRNNYPDLIAPTRNMISCRPYAIENVAAARSLLVDPFFLCGSMFGLRTQRHRYFETNFNVHAPRGCDHSERPLLVTTAGANSRRIGNFKSVAHAPLAYGIDWMTGDGLREAIPPAYSKHIGLVAINLR